ncbi:MAG: 1,2-phenylacetyl-CoA epoxidase subunit PaaD [Pseudomonadota bacterium]
MTTASAPPPSSCLKFLGSSRAEPSTGPAGHNKGRASIELVWSWLDEVPDPEIPVISVVDLGIVREVAWHGEDLQIAITPTYSGCPATSVISMDIETALRARGIDRVRVSQQLSPAWTTDWLSDKGRARLEEYGIAPPTAAGQPERCPLCQSANVERISQFGSTPCKAQWRCRDCLEPFDYFKCI